MVALVQQVYKDQLEIREPQEPLGHKVFRENMQALVQQVPAVFLDLMDQLVQLEPLVQLV
jgi:hypothetical protein